jgi:phospholipase C
MNPVKKRIIKTECDVHKYINNQAVMILKNDGMSKAYEMMSSYISDINSGVVWADQNFRSSNHFFNPITNRGLYGSSNAKKECFIYYTRALDEFLYGDKSEAMFCLGVVCHLIQDLTVPQHASVKLLNEHRKFENWVIINHKSYKEFTAKDGGIYLNSLRYYIEMNSKKALAVYKRFSGEKDHDMRFYKITSVILILAQKSTAGVMYKFFYDLNRIIPVVNLRMKKAV